MSAKKTPIKGSVNKTRGKMDRSFLVGVTSAPVAQAQRRVEDDDDGPKPAVVKEQATLVPLPGVRTGIDRETGVASLHIVATDANGKALPPFVLDPWMRYGEIGVAFAEAAYANGRTTTAVHANIHGLRPFFAWLEAEYPDSPPTLLSDLTSQVLLRYRSYLDGAKDKNGKPIGDNSKRTYLGKMRLPFEWMKTGAPHRWGTKLADGLRLPQGTWKAVNKRSEPRDMIAPDALAAIVGAAARAVERILERFEKTEAMIEEGRRRLPADGQKRGDFADLSVALAAIDEWYGGYLSGYTAAKDRHPGFSSAIVSIHGAKDFFHHLYPGTDDLVPFVILLTMHTAYNPETILGMRVDQVATNDFFADQFGFDLPDRHNSREQRSEDGQVRISLAAKKRRANGKAQHRSFRVDTDDKFGVYLLLDALSEITKRIRPHSIRGHEDRVFLFHQVSVNSPVRSFGTGKRPICNDGVWTIALNSFIAENHLPHFSLAQLRTTVADAAEQITGDIRAVQLLLCHSGTSVTFQHYLSAGGRRRASEDIATVQGVRQRWVDTGGKRDMREPSQGDTLMAVTPGFHCLDPFDSPMPSQVAGKMCSAWLACALCPLATVRTQDGEAMARLIQLEDHVRNSQATISPERYGAAYVPLLRKLAEWLEQFSSKARKDALAVTYLKPLPELE
jgi:hypothetical protein